MRDIGGGPGRGLWQGRRLLFGRVDGVAAGVLQTLQFTLGMKWARLLMAIVTSLVAGAVTGWISPSSRWAPLIVGSVDGSKRF